MPTTTNSPLPSGDWTASGPHGPAELMPADAEFRVGDAVVHLDRGMGLLQGLETLETDISGAADLIRLGYADDDKLLAPVEELDRIWRYGAGDAVTLDRLEGEAW